MNPRDNWRIYLLVALVVLSGIALFVPGSGGGAQAAPPANGSDGGTGPTTNGTGDTGPVANGTVGNGTVGNGTVGNGTVGNETIGNGTDGNGSVSVDTFQQPGRGGGLTNLRFGLELSGGTRLRAGLVGLTAENVPMEQGGTADLESAVAEHLGLDLIDVNARNTAGTQTGTVEVFSRNVTESEVREALQAADAAGSDVTIRDGVTVATRETAERVLQNKIDQVGLSGGNADTITTPTGEHFVVVEVPNANTTDVLRLIGDPGRVQIVASYPEQTENGTVQRDVEILNHEDILNPTPPQETEGGQPYVGVTVRGGEPAQRFVQVLNDRGFTTEGVRNCRWDQNPEDPGYCLKTLVDGEVVYAAGLHPSLADSIRTESWLGTRSFQMETQTFARAQELQVHLQAGALPTELDIQSQYYLAPSLAQQFKPLALLTGLVAWLTVAGVIFYRYREVRIAVPMLLTAFAEVWILLGFAVAVGLALDLSHIAGLIAVIGTGVDDLVIIADEIMQRGDIATDRVFKNRFRKAFWVIGAAAITTIIAMSPLAFLSLGDLQGFAIVTIVGVLIGVLITRPAYGDILRNLLLTEES